MSYLHHKRLDHPMEQHIIIIPISCMGRKVLHRPRALLSEKLHMNVPHCRANNRRFPQLLLDVDMCHCGCMCVCACVCWCSVSGRWIFYFEVRNSGRPPYTHTHPSIHTHAGPTFRFLRGGFLIEHIAPIQFIRDIIGHPACKQIKPSLIKRRRDNGRIRLQLRAHLLDTTRRLPLIQRLHQL